MQDWREAHRFTHDRAGDGKPPAGQRERAARRGIAIRESGPCQFCGAAVSGGVEQCLAWYADVSGRIFQDPAYAAVHLFGVDAHALQHPEIHGRSNNNFHLLSLGVMLERGGSAQAGQRRAFLDRTLSGEIPMPPLDPPPPLQRGAVTVADVYAAATPREHQAQVRAWARAVWDAWAQHHAWAREVLKQL